MSDGTHREHLAAAQPDTSASIDVHDLTRLTGGRVERAGSALAHGGAVDSRRIEAGQIFFALPGDHTDGHRFLDEAVTRGAAALVISESLSSDRLDELHGADGRITVLRVDQVLPALHATAAGYRDRFDPLTVGITGSIAKTSTKEQVAEVLAGRMTVLRSQGNENNEIGLPLTLLRLASEHEVAVLEMGLFTTGEIALLARLARPSIGVVTAVRGVHLSRAGSIEAIEAGKRELVEALPPSGWAVLNVDDPRVAAMASQSPARVLGYGFSASADVTAGDVESLALDGMRFRLRLPDGPYDITTPMLGRHGVHNALAAAAVAVCAGLSPSDIVSGLSRRASAPHRTQLLQAGDWNILDDSYNASPDAVLAALDLLAELPGRRISVLGEMLELGDAADEGHLRVGAKAAAVVDRLLVVGAGAAGIVEGAAEAGLDASRIRFVADRDEALAWLITELRPGDTVLVKASRGAELELLVDGLMVAASGEASA